MRRIEGGPGPSRARAAARGVAGTFCSTTTLTRSAALSPAMRASRSSKILLPSRSAFAAGAATAATGSGPPPSPGDAAPSSETSAANRTSASFRKTSSPSYVIYGVISRCPIVRRVPGDCQGQVSQRWPKWCAAGSAAPTSRSATARASGPRRLELRDDDVAVLADPLVAAADEEQGLAAHDRAVALVDVRRDDQVDLAELVLEQHEDDALRGRRPLARDRQPAKATRLRCGASRSSALVSTSSGRCGRSSVSGCTSTETLVPA